MGNTVSDFLVDCPPSTAPIGARVMILGNNAIKEVYGKMATVVGEDALDDVGRRLYQANRHFCLLIIDGEDRVSYLPDSAFLVE
jgi:hypothetical protein